MAARFSRFEWQSERDAFGDALRSAHEKGIDKR
jgi:hypothetical protein